MNMTSNCDVTNSAHQIKMTTICHWMKSPMKIFCVRHWCRYISADITMLRMYRIGKIPPIYIISVTLLLCIQVTSLNRWNMQGINQKF